MPRIAALLLLLPCCAAYDPGLLELGKGGDSLLGADAAPAGKAGDSGAGGSSAPVNEADGSGGTRDAGGSQAGAAGLGGSTGGGNVGGSDSGAAGVNGGGGSVLASADAGAGGAGDGGIDPNCLSTSTAKEGAACTRDCVVVCGFENMGTKTCVCTTMIYSQCSCPRPVEYLGALTAGYCATADGTTLALKNTPCSQEWDECVGKDAVSGVTPQGCACLKDKVSGQLLWSCQSTNQWFRLGASL